MPAKKQEPRQRTHTFTCKPCLIIFKIEIHDKDYKNMKKICCPLCGERIK